MKAIDHNGLHSALTIAKCLLESEADKLREIPGNATNTALYLDRLTEEMRHRANTVFNSLMDIETAIRMKDSPFQVPPDNMPSVE